jgi:hypothetical protein
VTVTSHVQHVCYRKIIEHGLYGGPRLDIIENSYGRSLKEISNVTDFVVHTGDVVITRSTSFGNENCFEISAMNKIDAFLRSKECI